MNIILFIITLSVLIFIHEFGHFIFAKLFNVYCLEFSIGMGPSLISRKFKKDKETTYSIRCLPIGGYVSMAGENLDDNEEIKELNIPYQRTINGISPWKRAIVTVAGVVFNFVFALVLLTIFIFVNGVAKGDNTIEVSNNSLASYANISSGDKIVGIKGIEVKANGEIIYSDNECRSSTCTITYFSDFTQYINNDKIFANIESYKQNHPNENIKIIQDMVLVYTHKGTQIEQNAPITRDYDNETKSFELIGINEARRTPGFFEGIGKVFTTFGEIIVLMFKAIGQIFTADGFNSLGGVVSMYQSSKAMASAGVLSYIWYMAIISINLGFFNLLPIPALDGARFYISIVEGISKKKLNPKIEGYMNLSGLVLLFSLMIVVTIKDIVGLF